MNTEVENLKIQLSIARKEIKNLRHQIKSLSFVHRKDLENIRNVLQSFKCQNCKVIEKDKDAEHVNKIFKSDEIPFKPIGLIKTVFDSKRAVPRQATVGPYISSCIKLNNETFNNAEHSIQGLDEFSHIWIIYHFHKNASHTKAKITPPRLSGEKIGVFSSRSPHRPCPIGLSLVKIDRIDSKEIYFYGTDMIDGTPVLDIKPYIPIYDNPNYLGSTKDNDFLIKREAPDGEETTEENNIPSTSTTQNIRIPNWIRNNNKLTVVFSEIAQSQLIKLNIEKKTITDILEADPRSIYLRTKYGSQIYIFQLGDQTVTCKFDDKNFTVYVLKIREKQNLSD